MHENSGNSESKRKLELSWFLFAVILDEITKDVKDGLLKKIPYADDLVLLGEN